MKECFILGINTYHGDAAACLLWDGKIVAKAEEERFRRIKHWAGFPSQAIQYCLQTANISLSQIGILAINSNPKANFFKKINYILRNKPSLNFILDRLKNHKARFSIERELSELFPKEKFQGKICRVEHHLSHLASAFFASPFEEALVLSVDGFGDFTSCAWGVGKNNEIDIKGKIYFPHSLGAFYQAMTQYLGFPHFGDEYKVMGLAPYGKPRFINEMKEIVKLKEDGMFELNLEYFCFQKKEFSYTWKEGMPHSSKMYSERLCELLGPAREPQEIISDKHRDIACSIQYRYEEAFFHLLNQLCKIYPLENLAFAGGCAMNSVANGKIIGRTNLKKIYIPAAAGDAGGAVGAALLAWKKTEEGKKEKKNQLIQHAFWGPAFSDKEIETLLKEYKVALEKENCSIERFSEEGLLCEHTARAIAQGSVVGWFQGRMEWGPRALGNRSILGDPRRQDMKDILNLKIKRRESFRPFAPSILREAVLDWFEVEDDVPFMMQVFKIRQAKRSIIPAVTHVDGTGRLQTVHQDTNPRYYHLISAFKTLTQIPLLLNTSFNENEPVVCKPIEALHCFLRTKMDVLVLGDYFLCRKN